MGNTWATILSVAKTKKQKISSSSHFNELVSYNKTDFEISNISNFNILDWWRAKSSPEFYPIMAIMARDLLTVQASTIASESAFSLSGRILTDRRSNLSPQSLEICVCYKDYLDAEKREQHINSADAFFTT